MKKFTSNASGVEKITFSSVEVVRKFVPGLSRPKQDTNSELFDSEESNARLVAKYGRTLSFKNYH